MFVVDVPHCRIVSGNALAAALWSGDATTGLAGLPLDRAMPAMAALARIAECPAPGPLSQALTFWTPRGAERFSCRIAWAGPGPGLLEIALSTAAAAPARPTIVPAVAAKISHEVRTPLTSILGFAEILRAQSYGPLGHAKYLEYAADIEDSARHALSLINDLLELSRTSAASLPMRFVALDANEVAQQCLAAMRPLADRGNIKLTAELATSPPLLIADRRALRQILLNLISNAIKFTAAGGEVRVQSTFDVAGSVRLGVTDNGTGMTAAEIVRALEPFEQVGGHAGSGEGAGLGLAITKSLVEGNGGRMKIVSEPGRGTIVTVEFPQDRTLPV